MTRNYRGSFAVEGFQEGSRNIASNSTQMPDAGRYLVENSQTSERATAELIVIGKYGQKKTSSPSF